MMNTRFTKKSQRCSLLGIIAIAVSLVLLSCYPGNPISTTEGDTVTTFRQKDFDFSSKRTYAMPDSVLYITEDNTVDPDPDRTHDQTILNAIDRNMQSMGYQKLNDPDQADVHILPVVTISQWVGGGCYPSWWCGWWYCYPGWCYPVAYTYHTGTILIAMMDPQQAGGMDDVEALWLAGINGLLASNVNTTQRINTRVDQAFAQSPYLGEGK